MTTITCKLECIEFTFSFTYITRSTLASFEFYTKCSHFCAGAIGESYFFQNYCQNQKKLAQHIWMESVGILKLRTTKFFVQGNPVPSCVVGSQKSAKCVQNSNLASVIPKKKNVFRAASLLFPTRTRESMGADKKNRVWSSLTIVRVSPFLLVDVRECALRLLACAESYYNSTCHIFFLSRDSTFFLSIAQTLPRFICKDTQIQYKYKCSWWFRRNSVEVFTTRVISIYFVSGRVCSCACAVSSCREYCNSDLLLEIVVSSASFICSLHSPLPTTESKWKCCNSINKQCIRVSLMEKLCLLLFLINTKALRASAYIWLPNLHGIDICMKRLVRRNCEGEWYAMPSHTLNLFMRAEEARVAPSKPFSLNTSHNVRCGWVDGAKVWAIAPLPPSPLLLMCVHRNVLTHRVQAAAAPERAAFRHRRCRVIWCLCQYLDTKHYFLCCCCFFFGFLFFFAIRISSRSFNSNGAACLVEYIVAGKSRSNFC